MTWTAATANPTPDSSLWNAAACSVDGVILIAGSSGGLYISTNSGATWSLNTGAPENLWYWSVACSADGTRIIAAPYDDMAVGNPVLLYLSEDSGSTWAAASLPSNHWSAVSSSADGTKLIALAFNGPIYVSTNSGASWTSNNVIGYWRSAACSADGTKAVAVADPGEIYTSTDSGVTWVSHFIFGAGTGFGSVASSADGERLLAVGFQSGSGIYVSTNSGSSWKKDTHAPSAVWNAVASSADGHKVYSATYGYVVGGGGGIYTQQTAPSPKVDWTRTGTNSTLSWTAPSANFVLEENMDLTSTNWLRMTQSPSLDLTSLRYHVTLFLTNNSGFYRLASP
jgi:photosystem II stability/assembly factor-like uncharacterized protein